MARKEKDKKDSKENLVNRRKEVAKDEEQQEIFAPLKVAMAVQQQIKDFKVQFILIADMSVNGWKNGKKKWTRTIIEFWCFEAGF